MTDRTELLAAILSDPACDVKRLAYADLLEDSGEVERAEFIRAHIKGPEELWQELWNDSRLNGAPHPWFMGIKGVHPRALHLSSYNIPKVSIRFRDARIEFQLVRGFLGLLRGPLAALLAHGPAIVAANPVERVEVTDLWVIKIRDDLPGIGPALWMGQGGSISTKAFTTPAEAHAAFNAAVLAELRRRAGEKSDTISTCHGTTSEHGLNRAG